MSRTVTVLVSCHRCGEQKTLDEAIDLGWSIRTEGRERCRQCRTSGTPEFYRARAAFGWAVKRGNPTEIEAADQALRIAKIRMAIVDNLPGSPLPEAKIRELVALLADRVDPITERQRVADQLRTDARTVSRAWAGAYRHIADQLTNAR